MPPRAIFGINVLFSFLVWGVFAWYYDSRSAFASHPKDARRNYFGLALNVIGTSDLLYAFYIADRVGVGHEPGLQGAAYFIPTALVPLLIITHGIVFRLLLQQKDVSP